MSKPPPDDMDDLEDDPFDIPTVPILAPIPGTDPAGEDLRYDPVYDLIQEARRDEDTNTPQGIWTSKVKRADWGQVRAEIEAALTERSKDLQLAVWLAEALLQLDGLNGLAQGLRLVTSLSLGFWPVLYPKLDEDDPEARLAPIYWLDSKLPARIGQLPFTAPNEADGSVMTWQDLVAAQRLEPLARTAAAEYQAAVKNGAVTVAKFESAVRATGTAFYQAAWNGLQSSLDALQALRTTLDELSGDDAPAMASLNRILEAMSGYVRVTLAERGVSSASASSAAARGSDGAGQDAPATEARRGRTAATEPEPVPVIGGAQWSGAITTREQAYNMLSDAADYLLRTEPHSPTPYLVRRAVAWGRMSLNDLLAELIEDDTGRKSLQSLLQLPEN